MTTIYLHGFSGDDKGLADFAEALDVRPYYLLLMPGFGGSTVRRAARDNLGEYCHDVIEQINTITTEKIHLIGHSHGAIIAYSVAALYPDRVARLTLINPVARPQLSSRALSTLIRGATWVVPTPLFLRVLRSRHIVDAVSRYLTEGHHISAQARVKAMRRNETKYYHKDMFRLSNHATSFKEFMKESRVTCPTTILFDAMDNVAGPHAAAWYAAHTSNPTLLEVTGGHLGVVATPEIIAGTLRGAKMDYNNSDD
ncbi:MAG: alpha/beta hydrolase [Candidatus Saccharimonadales bacterium]